MKKIKIGILGYGNLGKGVEWAVSQCEDIEFAGIFTRRNPMEIKTVNSEAMVFPAEELEFSCSNEQRHDIDVLILCGGSATDLPMQTPKYAKLYNVIDSFDNHSEIPLHFNSADKAAREGGHIAMISAGWDPGLFSLNRALAKAVLPMAESYTFWGRGVSQGHSDAIRRIKGVKDARQYTVPVESAMEAVRLGESPSLSMREKHTRECFVAAEEGTDIERIEREIKTMPSYFSDYDTVVHFVSQEEINRDHGGIPHGGSVIRTGRTGWEKDNKAAYELKLNMDSNPEFCAGILVAYARAIYKMAAEGMTGCKTIFDIPIAYILPLTAAEMRKKLL